MDADASAAFQERVYIYHILGVILALRDFTCSELSELTGAPLPLVLETVHRHSRILRSERQSREITPEVRRHHLRAESEYILRAELGELYQHGLTERYISTKEDIFSIDLLLAVAEAFLQTLHAAVKAPKDKEAAISAAAVVLATVRDSLSCLQPNPRLTLRLIQIENIVQLFRSRDVAPRAPSLIPDIAGRISYRCPWPDRAQRSDWPGLPYVRTAA